MAPDMTPRVLLVDDDLRLRGLLETFLRREGFQVAVAGNGHQMQKALQELPIDLMVLDLVLPGRSGLDICRDLRAAENSLPIIMLTAKGDDIDRILGLEIGADDYLPKPCNPRELVKPHRPGRPRSTACPCSSDDSACIQPVGRSSATECRFR
jgi:two-component system phosphate regulon response regulator OmpR